MLDKIQEAARPLWPNSLRFILLDEEESSDSTEKTYDSLSSEVLMNDLLRTKWTHKSNVGYGGNMATKKVSFFLYVPSDETDPRFTELQQYASRLADASKIFTMEVIQGKKKSEKILSFYIHDMNVANRHKGHLSAVFKTGNLIEEALNCFLAPKIGTTI